MSLHGRDSGGFTPAAARGRRRLSKQYGPAELRRALIAPSSRPSDKRRRRARDAAEALGVDVPDWAQKAMRAQSDEAREHSRDAALRRHNR